MIGEVEACTECTRNCVLIHRQNLGEVPKVFSFFKVMFGKRFSKVMSLPPKLTKTFRLCGGKKMYLQDSSGQKWPVVLSKENGGLAFLYGWSEFVQGHGIEVGDFVVFHYLKKSLLFAVQIFGRSGCEKRASFTKKNEQNKRTKTSRDASDLHHLDDVFTPEPPAKKKPSACGVSQANDDVIYQRDEGENNISASSTMAGNAPSREDIAQGLKGKSATKFVDDLSCMLYRNTSFPKGDKEDLFDLSMFEMPEKKVFAEEAESPTASVDAKKFQVTEGNTFSGSCLLKKEFSSLQSGYPSNDMPPCSSMTEKPVQMPHRSESSRTGIVKQEPSEFTEDFGADVVAGASLGFSCKNANVSGDGEPGIVVKSEPIDPFDSSSETVANVTCLVQANNESFLELPEPLPIRACREANVEKKLVILHDSAGRFWPVLYHQRLGFNVLASGWAAFRKANDIQQSNECTFAVENRDEGIFAVTVHRS